MGDLRAALVNSVQEAGLYTKKAAQRGRKKSDGILEIEKRCRGIMASRIREWEPQISLWGENGRSRETVVACPIDSAINFTRGLDYSVMIAYCEAGVPTVAAIYFPNSQETCVAEAGKGTRLDGRNVEVSSREQLHGTLISCHCSHYSDEDDNAGIGMLHALAESNAAWRNLGSPGSEYCLVAAGKLDGIIVASAESMHAAGYLIMKEAGAEVTDWRGKDATLFSHTIVAANRKLHAELLRML